MTETLKKPVFATMEYNKAKKKSNKGSTAFNMYIFIN